MSPESYAGSFFGLVKKILQYQNDPSARNVPRTDNTVCIPPLFVFPLKVIFILDLIAIFEVINSTRSVSSKLLCKSGQNENAHLEKHSGNGVITFLNCSAYLGSLLIFLFPVFGLIIYL